MELIPKHGEYRRLKSFHFARLGYDVTVWFCTCFLDKRSRTYDQMVQAARSGVQNIAEGSRASGTSKKTELKLTNVARASLEELRLDFEGFLRQRGLRLYEPNAPVLMRFKARRCTALEEFRRWVKDEHGLTGTDRSELAANAALCLLNLCCYLLDRQLAAQADAFEREGGFTERLYKFRRTRQ